MSHLGVHGVGEVDGRRALDEGDHATLRGEEVYLVLTEVEFQRFQERNRVVLFFFDVGQALHPGNLVGTGAFFIAPVGRDAELRTAVHLLGAHLDFDGLAPRADHRRVQ